MQKIYTLSMNGINRILAIPQVKLLLVRSAWLGLILGLSVYGCLKIFFHDFPLELVEETGLIVQVITTSWLLAVCLIGGFTVMMKLADSIEIKFARFQARKIAAIDSLPLSFEMQTNNRVLNEERLNVDSDGILNGHWTVIEPASVESTPACV